MESSIKLRADVTRHGGILRGQKFYRAQVGNVEGEGKTDVEAKRDLETNITRMCADIASPTIMWSLDGSAVWVCYPTAHEWMYSIERPTPGEQYTRGCTHGNNWTRTECLDRMRDHWYSSNVEDIVLGICALFTDLRQWVCARCATSQRGHAPYRCQNPRCGAAPGPFRW